MIVTLPDRQLSALLASAEQGIFVQAHEDDPLS